MFPLYPDSRDLRWKSISLVCISCFMATKQHMGFQVIKSVLVQVIHFTWFRISLWSCKGESVLADSLSPVCRTQLLQVKHILDCSSTFYFVFICRNTPSVCLLRENLGSKDNIIHWVIVQWFLEYTDCNKSSDVGCNSGHTSVNRIALHSICKC